jgi:hypothetical protein
MKQKVTVEIDLNKHGVRPPILDDIKFLVYREQLNEEGIYNPLDNEGTFEGAFQINIHAHREGYQELAKYFLGLAEYDVGNDPCFHEHHEPVVSADARTRLHIIFRKDDERYNNFYDELRSVDSDQHEKESNGDGNSIGP